MQEASGVESIPVSMGVKSMGAVRQVWRSCASQWVLCSIAKRERHVLRSS